ncbi:porin family protein [Bradyrhizobium jicamae]|uniref:outer membrane protein n=1 Tax=Bradyrhizobium jicamae TaxID=280332 RepID=UPI001BA4ABB4|nr:outer membrane beta-barrel protein [Bradyrhizobium jicamae]MBR0752997.1 porin family protein [Bradyrhizobium jicamae]
MIANRMVVALVLAGIVGVQAEAFSADLPPGTLVTKAPASVAYRWTGCYVGANVGGGSGRTSFTDVRPMLASPLDLGSERTSGALGGGQVGCDYQAGGWVFGVQGLYDASDLKGSHQLVPGPADPRFPNIYDLSSRMSWFATATARVGYAIQPQILIYAKGGAAWTQSTVDYAVTGMGITSPYAGAGSHTGWTAGGGVEYLLAPNWSLFAEYNYLDFGSTTPTLQGNGAAAGFTTPIQLTRRIDTAMFGVNYRFGPLGP